MNYFIFIGTNKPKLTSWSSIKSIYRFFIERKKVYEIAVTSFVWNLDYLIDEFTQTYSDGKSYYSLSNSDQDDMDGDIRKVHIKTRKYRKLSSSESSEDEHFYDYVRKNAIKTKLKTKRIY